MWITDDPGWRRVRFNRRRIVALVVFGPLTAAVGFLAVVYVIRPEFMFLGFAVLVNLPFTLGLLGFFLFLQGSFFRYDVHSFTVKGQDFWGLDSFRRWRRGGPSPWSPDKEIEYPEPGFERLEYSIAYAEIYAVRPDGTRKRLWMRARWADPGDWEAFVRHLRRLGVLREES